MPTPHVTHVLTITDRSGSMGPVADDVRGGFNAYIGGLRDDTASTYKVTAVLFDEETTFLCENAALDQVPALDTTNYTPRRCTALLDAVGTTMERFRDSAGRTLADADRVLVVIQTDGHENSSRRYTWAQVRDLVNVAEATGKYTVIYLGTGLDTWDQASRMGVTRDQYITTGGGGQSVGATYSGLHGATVAYSGGASGAEASRILAKTPGVVTGE